MITMRQARKEFAARVTTRAAVYENRNELIHNTEEGVTETRVLKVKTAPRKRALRPKGSSFRAWARAQYKTQAANELCPKLHQILVSDPSKR